jgi:hypothetical protein
MEQKPNGKLFVLLFALALILFIFLFTPIGPILHWYFFPSQGLK